ncbi:hypothetical protein MKZ38_010278 [Zalerion maritima]|uniref:DUF155 domain-containing protein n=1 Tax=Zalerion maritima TaxID=339359 RepID=A0AAD5WMV8_9PEZI|nr:hypothetical protein MKZ38_010278 [Zalerion maritima]
MMEDASLSTERTCLLPPPVTAPRARRTVTFHDNPVSKTIEPAEYSRSPARGGYGETSGSGGAGSSSSHMMAAAPLGGISSNSFGGLKPRRRNSAGPGGSGIGAGPTSLSSSYGPMATTSALSSAVAAHHHLSGFPKVGPQRSTKTAQKLKELPLPDFGDEGPDEESGREVYSQYTRIKDPKARRDAARLGKADRARLPRVTAYCTANKYQQDSLMRWLKNNTRKRGTNPKRIDECIYSPFSYTFRRDGGGSSNQTPIDGYGSASGSGTQTPVDDVIQEEELLLTPSTPGTPYGGNGFEGRDGMFPPMPLPGDDSGVDGMCNSELRNEVEEAMRGEGSSSRDSRGLDGGGGDPGLNQIPPLERQQRQGDHQSISSPDTILKPSSSAPAVIQTDVSSPPPAPTPATVQAMIEETGDPDLDITVDMPEIFLFEYGVVVIWGMTEAQEAKLLKDVARWSPVEKLDEEQIEAEYFNFYYTREYQARIYNDFITLRRGDKSNYMTKLAISHGLAQSVKTNLYEELIAVELEGSKDLPAQIAMAGKMAMSKTEINMKIGKLFILRIQVHLNGSVLDTPELFWTEPHLEPVYQATRRYLEMDQRVEVLANRLSVIGDLLTVLKDQLSHGHGEMLEWIVIVLIAAEILVAVVNIIVDVYAGVDA